MNQSPIFTKLQDNIYDFNNQYYYSEKVHVYLIELDDKILLFDIPTYSLEAKEFIISFSKPIYALLSHGSCGIGDGTRWQNEIDMKVYVHKADESHPWIRMNPDVLFTEMPNFDESLEVIHTPGHSAGSVCLLDSKSKSLFSGDTIYGNEKGELRDFTKESQSDYENLENRIGSAKKLLNYEFVNVYPFHYDIILEKGKEKLIEFVRDK